MPYGNVAECCRVNISCGYFTTTASVLYVSTIPANIPLLGTSFQKARRAFWVEARPGFGVHWCVYTNGHPSPRGLRDARKGVGVQHLLVLNTTETPLNADALASVGVQ